MCSPNESGNPSPPRRGGGYPRSVRVHHPRRADTLDCDSQPKRRSITACPVTPRTSPSAAGRSASPIGRPPAISAADCAHAHASPSTRDCAATACAAAGVALRARSPSIFCSRSAACFGVRPAARRAFPSVSRSRKKRVGDLRAESGVHFACCAAETADTRDTDTVGTVWVADMVHSWGLGPARFRRLDSGGRTLRLSLSADTLHVQPTSHEGRCFSHFHISKPNISTFCNGKRRHRKRRRPH